MKKSNNKNYYFKSIIKDGQRGFAAFYIAILVLAVVFIIAINIFILSFDQQKISANIVKSSQAYYIAESGIEDATYRIRNMLNVPSSYSIDIGSGSAEVSINSPNQNTKIITSLAENKNVFRELETILITSTVNPKFFYGVQAGNLGVEMYNNSRIEGKDSTPGNVYSNGPIIGSPGATITGTVMVALANSLKNVIIYEDAYANTISSIDAERYTRICGDAYYQNIDSYSNNFLNNPITCSPQTPGTGHPGSSDIPLADMPISETVINEWKAGAATGGTLPGMEVNSDISLGPKKIDGNLIFKANNKTLTVTGTIYVTGNIVFDPATGTTVKCSASYGLNSCVIVADGYVQLKNNATFSGSGQPESYVMFLSASNCDGSSPINCATGNSAIYIKNNARGAVFYANNGLVNVENGIEVTEITGRKIRLNPNAKVIYEQGLTAVGFTSGPGKSWQVYSWKEIE